MANDDTELIATLNLINGQVAVNPRGYLAIYDYLVEVPETFKAFESTKYKAQTKEEFFDWQAQKAAKEDADRAAAEKQAADDAEAAKQALADQAKVDAAAARASKTEATPVVTATNESEPK